MDVKSFSYVVFHAFIKYLYTDEVDLKPEDAVGMPIAMSFIAWLSKANEVCSQYVVDETPTSVFIHYPSKMSMDNQSWRRGLCCYVKPPFVSVVSLFYYCTHDWVSTHLSYCHNR